MPSSASFGSKKRTIAQDSTKECAQLIQIFSRDTLLNRDPKPQTQLGVKVPLKLGFRFVGFPAEGCSSL